MFFVERIERGDYDTSKEVSSFIFDRLVKDCKDVQDWSRFTPQGLQRMQENGDYILVARMNNCIVGCMIIIKPGKRFNVVGDLLQLEEDEYRDMRSIVLAGVVEGRRREHVLKRMYDTYINLDSKLWTAGIFWTCGVLESNKEMRLFLEDAGFIERLCIPVKDSQKLICYCNIV